MRGNVMIMLSGLLIGAGGMVLLMSGPLTVVKADCPGEGGTPCGNGDVNADGRVDIADGVYILQYLFAEGPEIEQIEPPPCDSCCPPLPPQDFVCSPSDGGVTLSWSNPVDYTNLVLSRNGTILQVESDQTGYEDAGLLPGEFYNYSIRGAAGGIESIAATCSITLGQACPPPPISLAVARDRMGCVPGEITPVCLWVNADQGIAGPISLSADLPLGLHLVRFPEQVQPCKRMNFLVGAELFIPEGDYVVTLRASSQAQIAEKEITVAVREAVFSCNWTWAEGVMRQAFSCLDAEHDGFATREGFTAASWARFCEPLIGATHYVFVSGPWTLRVVNIVVPEPFAYVELGNDDDGVYWSGHWDGVVHCDGCIGRRPWSWDPAAACR